MYSLIRKWESSGLSQTQFFRQNGVSKSTFGYWRKKYLNEEGKNKPQDTFIPVKIANTPKADNNPSVLEVVYPNGVRLVCSAGMDLSRLKPLIIL